LAGLKYSQPHHAGTLRYGTLIHGQEDTLLHRRLALKFLKNDSNSFSPGALLH
jgi:hypothetical protein